MVASRLLAFSCATAVIESAASNVSHNCAAARAVLDTNWDEATRTTLPALGLYPHQWSWDTAFIAVGHAKFNLTRAKEELRQLFAAQWSNGMVPHIVFNPDVARDAYFPGPNWWKSSEAAPGNAPTHVETSGITNPPVHSAAVLAIAEAEGNTSFLLEMFEKLDKFLSYLRRDRNPTQTGLIYVRHPWENGEDNSVLWDVPLYDGITNATIEETVPAYNRTDIHKGVDPRDRPSQAFYDRAVYLMLQARNNSYDEVEAWKAGLGFAVYDAMFNALVVSAYEDMIEIAERLGKADAAERYQAWAEELAEAIELALWDEKAGVYASVNALTNKRLRARSNGGVMPLVYSTRSSTTADLRDERVKRILKELRSRGFCGDGSCSPLPSLALDDERFDPRNYWRGPVWINVNWLLIRGLQRHSQSDRGDEAAMLREAAALKEAVTSLVERGGFHEYFDPTSGEAHGTANFSWTAALYHDLLCGSNSSETGGATADGAASSFGSVLV